MHEAAKQVDYVLQPGEKVPSENPNAGKDEPSSDSSDSSGGGSSLSGGAIAGIVIGAVAAFALTGLLFFLVGRKKKSRELAEKNAAAVAAASPPAPQGMYDADQHPGVVGEHPPMYHDPRYSTQMPASPRPWSDANPKHGHVSMMSEEFNPTGLSNHPNRLSELPSQNYDPVEIYTPGLPEHNMNQQQNNVPSPVHEHPENDNRRSMGPQ